MAQIGTFGEYDIPIYEEANVEDPFLYMYCPEAQKLGVLNMVPLSDVPASEYPTLFHKRDKDGIEYGSRRTANRVIDDFERGNLNPYVRLGATGNQSVTSRAALEGDRGLQITGYTELYSGSGSFLPYLPEVGTIFECHFRLANIGSPEFWYGTVGTGQGFGNHYQLEWFPDGAFQIRRYLDGNAKKIAWRGNVSLNAGTWYRWEIQWRVPGNTNDHVVNLFNYETGTHVARITGNDTSLSDPMVGFGGADNMEVHFDKVRRLDSRL